MKEASIDLGPKEGADVVFFFGETNEGSESEHPSFYKMLRIEGRPAIVYLETSFKFQLYHHLFFNYQIVYP